MAVSYLAQPKIFIDGSEAASSLLEDVLQIVVEESLHLPAMFTLVISNPRFSGQADDSINQHAKLFAIGKKIKISFAASTTESKEFSQGEKGTVIEGEITGMETHFTKDSQAPIIVRGYDVAHRLHRGRFNRSFQDKTDGDIVGKIIQEVGISKGTVDQGNGPHDYVFQENQTNMEFLRERAARNGFELFVQDNKLNFRKPKAESTLELVWLKELQSFHVRVSSAEQVSSVEVRGWDYKEKKAVVETAKSQSLITSTDEGEGKKTSSSFGGKPSSPKMIVVDQPFFLKKEATAIANSLFNELSGEFVQADARADGSPEIRPGKKVKLKEMGKYSGSYYITETRHLYQEGIYTTDFSVRGLRDGDLFSTVKQPRRLQPGQTLMVGIVTDNQDPEGWGRVRVKFPTLTPEDDGSAHASNWARVVAIGASAERGLYCLPEIDDEVLVAFEHGDIHRPYILGGVWNGKDKTPDTIKDSVVEGKVRLRTFKTRTGHQWQFVEEDKDSSKKGFYLKTVYGHEINCHDTDEEKFIEIKTKDGNQFLLNDKEEMIQVKTKGGHTMTFSDKDKKIEIKSTKGHAIAMDDSGKEISLSSVGNLNIKADKDISIKGKNITIDGSSNITQKVSGTKATLSSQSFTAKGSNSATVEGGMSATLKGGTSVTVKGGMSASVKATSVSLG